MGRLLSLPGRIGEVHLGGGGRWEERVPERTWRSFPDTREDALMQKGSQDAFVFKVHSRAPSW